MKDELKNKLEKLKGAKNIEDIPFHKEVPPPKKMGRKKHLKDDVNYIKVSAYIEEATHDAMKLSMILDAKGLHPTQNHYINAAILFYAKELKSKKEK